MKLAGLLCIFALTLSAKEYAPLPKEIVSAKKVHLTDESGDLKLLDALYERIKKWRHWELVAEASQADIVIVLTGQQRNVGTFTTGQVSASGTFGSGYALGFPIIQHMRYLVFIEPTTKTTLFVLSKERVTAGATASRLLNDLRKRLGPAAARK